MCIRSTGYNFARFGLYSQAVIVQDFYKLTNIHAENWNVSLKLKSVGFKILGDWFTKVIECTLQKEIPMIPSNDGQ